jgi:hypothetical protein
MINWMCVIYVKGCRETSYHWYDFSLLKLYELLLLVQRSHKGNVKRLQSWVVCDGKHTWTTWLLHASLIRSRPPIWLSCPSKSKRTSLPFAKFENLVTRWNHLRVPPPSILLPGLCIVSISLFSIARWNAIIAGMKLLDVAMNNAPLFSKDKPPTCLFPVSL